MLDPDGRLTVLTRRNDLIISGGENVYPAEVEAVLAAHPDIVELAVIGVPDAKWGEAVQAVVVLREAGSVSADALIEWTKGRIAGYKRPKSVLIIGEAEMPRTATGKIQHRVLRDRLLPK
jgi:acyl-CoA synthetase (AMP-forming)/AMP-acid ligase II